MLLVMACLQKTLCLYWYRACQGVVGMWQACCVLFYLLLVGLYNKERWQKGERLLVKGIAGAFQEWA
jgi:hypothetical protein